MFAPKKQAWYFRTGEYKVTGKSNKTLDEIRSKYGSEVLKDDRPKRQYLRR